MYRRQEVKSEWGFMGDIAKIAFGVFIGIMAANGVEEAIAKWRIEQASRQMVQELKVMQDKERLAEQQRQQYQQQQQERLQLQQQQQRWQQEEKERLRQQQLLAVRKKEQAWSNFYQPSYTCRADPSRGDCADAHIRARKSFEAQYRD